MGRVPAKNTRPISGQVLRPVGAHLPPATSAQTLEMSSRCIKGWKLVLVETSSENVIFPASLPSDFMPKCISSIPYFKIKSKQLQPHKKIPLSVLLWNKAFQCLLFFLELSLPSPYLCNLRKCRWPPGSYFTREKAAGSDEMQAWLHYSRGCSLALLWDLAQGKSVPTKWNEQFNPLWFWNSEVDLTQS